MPIYEYRCSKCGTEFEEWQNGFTEKQSKCPDCSGPSERIISNTSFVLKGSGWYASGYSKSAPASPGPK